tara:strand:+ start:2759 stop:4420 length:1662 start_codon:yes stop_codon:yes gene_type:complete
MPDYGITQDELSIISGSLFLFRSGTLSDDTTAISASVPQIVAISCSANTNNKLTRLTTQQVFGVITITSGSSNLEQDTKLVLRYTDIGSISNEFEETLYVDTDDTLDHVLGGINTNIVYVNIPLQNNDDAFAVAYKTVAALTGSIGFNKHYSASLIEDTENLISFSGSLGENLKIGSSFKIRPTGSALHISGGFLIHSLNSGSVAIPDFSGTAAQIGGMEIGDTFIIGGGISSEIFKWNIYQSGSGELNQPFFEGNKVTSSANLGLKLDPADKTSAFITGSNRSASMYFSGSGQMGFGTTNPKTDFDIRANKFYVQQRLDTKGIFINEDGDLESYNRTTSGSATGSEFILKYSRGGAGSITVDLIQAVLGESAIDDGASRATIDAFVKSQSPEVINELLQVGEEEGLLSTRPQTGDVIGSVRWIADSGSLIEKVFDERKDGEVAKIQTTVAEAQDDGFKGNMQFFTATSRTAAPTEVMRIASDGNVHVTGSIFVSGDLTYQDELVIHSTASGNISASGFISTTSDITASGNISASGTITAASSNITTIDGGSF